MHKYWTVMSLPLTIFLLFAVTSISISKSYIPTNDQGSNDEKISKDILFNSLKFRRCLVTHGPSQIDALCSKLERLENPNDSNSRVITLSVVKLPSRSPKPAADAFTLIQGGPGASSIDLLLNYSNALEGIRAERDILVVDQRGTGRSHALRCPDIADEQHLIDAQKIKQLSQQCLDSLKADTRFYTTSIAVQDLDAVRHAAGYEQLSVYGVSYGTRVAQHYLRRFPKQTRAVILDGVSHIGLNLAGGEIARRSQASFDQMAMRCKLSEECNAQFGDIQLKFSELRTRLNKNPINMSLAHPVSGELTEKTLRAEDLLGVMRLMAYSSESNALLPLLISQAHANNYVPLAAQTMMIGTELSQSIAIGMSNSVICTEDAPFVKTNDLHNLEGTYLGDEMAKNIAAMCEIFPQGSVDDDFFEPFDSDVPVLILSGETDPITPPSNGKIAATMLSNSRHLIIPAHGHGVFARGCTLQLSSQFIDEGSLSELDSSCIQRERAMPFFIQNSGPKS